MKDCHWGLTDDLDHIPALEAVRHPQQCTVSTAAYNNKLNYFHRSNLYCQTTTYTVCSKQNQTELQIQQNVRQHTTHMVYRITIINNQQLLTQTGCKMQMQYASTDGNERKNIVLHYIVPQIQALSLPIVHVVWCLYVCMYIYTVSNQ